MKAFCYIVINERNKDCYPFKGHYPRLSVLSYIDVLWVFFFDISSRAQLTDCNKELQKKDGSLCKKEALQVWK